jgi:membrane fusion protein
LVPQAGLLNVTARAAGTITRVYVLPGAHVQAGAPLLTVSADRTSAAMGDTDAVVDTQLRAQEAQTIATLNNLKPQAQAQVKDLRARIAMLREQVVQTGEQLRLQQEEAVNRPGI